MADFVSSEARFAILQRTHPERAERLAELAQADVDERWHYYSQLAGIARRAPAPDVEPEVESDAGERYGVPGPVPGSDGNGNRTATAPEVDR